MKQTIYNILILLSLCAALQAQELISISRSGSSVQVVYTLPDMQVGRAYQSIYTPQLVGKTDSLRLNAITLQGQQKQKLEERRARFSKQDYTKRQPNRIQDSRTDTLLLPYPKYGWLLLDSVSLRLLHQTEGCCQFTRDTIQSDTTIVYTDRQRQLMPPRTAQSHIPDFTIIDSLHSGVLHPMDEYEPYSASRVLSREEGSLYVHFPVADSILTRSFRHNRETLDSIMYLIEQLMADTIADIKTIQIVGLASIEGDVKKNEDLAGNRAIALKRYIQEHYRYQPTLADDLFEVANGGEAWSELRYQVEQSEFAGRDEVLQIIDTEPNMEERERRIKALNRGKAYDYIRDHLLQNQRNSGYIRVYYDIVPDSVAMEINEAVEHLQRYEWDEAMLLLWKNREDDRAWNPLGVALYMTGREDEARQYWHRAADRGDTDAQDNLNKIRTK